MNYRHAYHAGNFADCFKHALLIGLLDSLTRKPSPFFVLDTHAGAGGYDLAAEPALRTAEAENGIGRIAASSAAALQRFFQLTKSLGFYPGSPAFIRTLLRERDRMACCELHPDDLASLRARFRGDFQVEVHGRSGWEALGALLPPKEKRGLVFIDPPFEAPDEFQLLADGLRRGKTRFGNGIFACWYPIKRMAAVRTFYENLMSSGIRDIIAIELHLRDITVPGKLNGCGMAVINPPYQFESQASSIAAAVLEAVGNDDEGANVTSFRLSDE